MHCDSNRLGLNAGEMSWSLQFFKALDERGVIAFALAGFSLNGLEDGTQAVKQLEKAGDEWLVGDEFSIAQKSEQIFARVGQCFQTFEAQESSGSLDGVHGAKDFAQESGILRARLKICETPLHAVQSFLAFDQELPRQFIHCVETFSWPGLSSRHNKQLRALSDGWVAT
jgi:hypothetical protein